MKHSSIIVKVEWDDEAKVWVATSDDIGLATEADTHEAVLSKATAMIVELLALEDDSYSDLPEIPIHFMAQTLARVRNPHFG
jgi:Domain of unknown function (DUF1902)